MANANEMGKDDFGLFLRAMVDREPGKRKVKPSKTALLDLAELDFGESSDDSDFNVDEAKLKEEDDISINSDPDDNGESETDEDEEDVEEKDERKSVNRSNSLSVAELLERAQQSVLNGIVDSSRPKILVCAICLGDYSDDTNEIVICDGCHVSVHEGCYGISDTISLSSTVSSSSTEPWFCDSCKAGVTDPPCELCPNLGYTIFKETETGKWTHLVCALYVPGVAFSEVDKLSFPTLFEMPYNRFGSKACSLCEDERYSKTGVCIGCDAGMCRSYFHVTCAQREGLLSEVNHGEADQADPYYAHCKLHSDKEQIRRRKRNWFSLQLSMKQGAKEKLMESQKIQDRLHRKLEMYKEKYLFTKANRPTPWFPTQKMPRSLSTSAFFFRSLLRKTELMGVPTEREHLATVGDIRKKWHIPPAFSVEYISYYLDRVSRLQELKNNLEFLIEDNKRLVKSELDLRDNYSVLETTNKSLKDQGGELMNSALELHDNLKKLAGRPLRLPPIVASLQDPLVASVPEEKANGSRRIITKAAAKMLTDTSTSGCAELSTIEKNPGLNLNICHVCNLSKDHHLLIQCDTCNNFYHLHCLDPPLNRMPKKTKQMGWQCSDCCKSSDSERIPEIDTAAPRKLRRIIKEPAKFSPSVPRDKRLSDSMSPPNADSAKNSLNELLNVVPIVTATAKSTINTVGSMKRRSSQEGSRGRKRFKRKGSFRGRSDSVSEIVPLTPKSSPMKSPNATPTRGRPKKVQVTAKPESITAQLRKIQNIVTTRQPTVALVPCKVLSEERPKKEKCNELVKVDSAKEHPVTRNPTKELPPRTPIKELAPRTPIKELASRTPTRETATRTVSKEIAVRTPNKETNTRTTTKESTTRTPTREPNSRTPTKEAVTRSEQKIPVKRGIYKVDDKLETTVKSDSKASVVDQPFNKITKPENPSVDQQKSTEEIVTSTNQRPSLADDISERMNSESNSYNAGELTESAPSTTTSSLPSPPTESVPSDDALCPRKEKRHRERKKKKKDKDKDKDSDMPRKRKKHHHRDKAHLAEMASEIVSPFRLKIKPLPPRPSENVAVTTAKTAPARTYAESLASHTTTTTTAPPGYPPLPPGYTLTQPVHVPAINCNNASLKSSFQLPYISVASGANSATSVITNQRSNVGRRKSDNAAEQFSKCDVCGEMGGVTNTVACDECRKAYHFNCLEPPLKKSPKRRGYSWFCEDCDNGAIAPVKG